MRYRNLLLPLTLLTVCLVVAACSTSRLTPQEKALIKQQQAQYVINSITDSHFVIQVDRVTPRRGMSHALSYGYSLVVKGDTIISHLPYFGQAYSLPFNGGAGLNLEAKIDDLHAVRNNKKAFNRIEITTHNSEDTFLYIVEVFDNGKAHIEVRSRRRETISFDGYLDMPLELQ
ncbi:MAG: DUF4251 domain-containing protein [Muribaculaceae bacterium]